MYFWDAENSRIERERTSAMTPGDGDMTLVLIKPDALKNSLTGYVLSLLSEFHTGLRFAALKVVHVSDMLAGEHYTEHRGKPFFPALIDYITGRAHNPDEPVKQRVIAIVYRGPDAVAKIRGLAGPTNPHVAREERPGCIRAMGTVVPLKDREGNTVGQRMDNLIHASASDEEAEREIKLWFRPGDVPPAMRSFATVRCEEHYYYKKGTLYHTNEPGSVCLLAPGDLAWRSDLDALVRLRRGEPADISLETVAAKYLINEWED
jgi:nucleoside-diphosphate kinase